MHGIDWWWWTTTTAGHVLPGFLQAWCPPLGTLPYTARLSLHKGATSVCSWRNRTVRMDVFPNASQALVLGGVWEVILFSQLSSVNANHHAAAACQHHTTLLVYFRPLDHSVCTLAVQVHAVRGVGSPTSS
jgi:hypothetical protein